MITEWHKDDNGSFVLKVADLRCVLTNLSYCGRWMLQCTLYEGQEQLKVLYKNMVIYIKTFYVLM